MAAELRRLKTTPAKISETVKEVQLGSPEITKISLDLSKSQTEISAKTATVENRYNYSYVSKDLRKLGALIVLTLLFEIGLNLTISTSFAKLILRTFGIEL